MSREEALKIWLPVIKMGVESMQECSEALDMAIKALEQEPCADMVSRDAMWEVLQRLYGTEGELVEELMSLPPVLPMPKMGKWVYDKEEDSYRCSLCTFPCHKDNLGAIPTNYCANCGSYNGGGDNGNE